MTAAARSPRARKRWGTGEGRAARVILADLIRIRQSSWKSDFSAGMARGYAASFDGHRTGFAHSTNWSAPMTTLPNLDQS